MPLLEVVSDRRSAPRVLVIRRRVPRVIRGRGPYTHHTGILKSMFNVKVVPNRRCEWAF